MGSSPRNYLNNHNKQYHFSFFLFFYVISLCSMYPVHPQEDARPSSGVAIVRVLQAGAVSQPGPLELTCFPLSALLQIILYEVFLLCAQHVLPLLSAVVVRWKGTDTREAWRENEQREGYQYTLAAATGLPASGL